MDKYTGMALKCRKLKASLYKSVPDRVLSIAPRAAYYSTNGNTQQISSNDSNSQANSLEKGQEEPDKSFESSDKTGSANQYSQLKNNSTPLSSTANSKQIASKQLNNKIIYHNTIASSNRAGSAKSPTTNIAFPDQIGTSIPPNTLDVDAYFLKHFRTVDNSHNLLRLIAQFTKHYSYMPAAGSVTDGAGGGVGESRRKADHRHYHQLSHHNDGVPPHVLAAALEALWFYKLAFVAFAVSNHIFTYPGIDSLSSTSSSTIIRSSSSSSSPSSLSSSTRSSTPSSSLRGHGESNTIGRLNCFTDEVYFQLVRICWDLLEQDVDRIENFTNRIIADAVILYTDRERGVIPFLTHCLETLQNEKNTKENWRRIKEEEEEEKKNQRYSSDITKEEKESKGTKTNHRHTYKVMSMEDYKISVLERCVRRLEEAVIERKEPDRVMSKTEKSRQKVFDELRKTIANRH